MTIEDPTVAPITIPSTPDAQTVTLWAGQLRTLIAVLAGMGLLGAAWKAVSAEQIANALTAFLTVAGILGAAVASVWSWWQKQRAAKLQHAAATASAVASANATQRAGTPYAIAVQVPPTVTTASITPAVAP